MNEWRTCRSSGNYGIRTRIGRRKQTKRLQGDRGIPPSFRFNNVEYLSVDREHPDVFLRSRRKSQEQHRIVQSGACLLHNADYTTDATKTLLIHFHASRRIVETNYSEAEP